MTGSSIVQTKIRQKLDRQILSTGISWLQAESGPHKARARCFRQLLFVKHSINLL